MLPGDGSCLDNVLLPVDPDDPQQKEVVRDPKRVADGVVGHWAKVFARKDGIDRDGAPDWLRDFDKRLDPERGKTLEASLIPDEEELLQVIKASGNSAPGPDGIPFQAYRYAMSCGKHVGIMRDNGVVVGLGAWVSMRIEAILSK